MNNIFLVYKTDNWHSYASRDIIGACTTLTIAIRIVKQQAKKDGEKLNKDTISFLADKLQTQDYAGDGEFQIEPINKNTLL